MELDVTHLSLELQMNQSVNVIFHPVMINVTSPPAAMSRKLWSTSTREVF
jgi:hypothetical protein